MTKLLEFGTFNPLVSFQSINTKKRWYVQQQCMAISSLPLVPAFFFLVDVYWLSGKRTITGWDTTTHQKLREFKGHEMTVTCLEVDDGVLYSGSEDMTIRVWNIKCEIPFVHLTRLELELVSVSWRKSKQKSNALSLQMRSFTVATLMEPLASGR